MTFGRVALATVFVVALALEITGYGWVVFVVLGSVCATVLGVALWHLFGPERERAHLRYRERVARRPKPASQWARLDPEPAPFVRPARDDIVPNKGRRMTALLPADDQPAAKQAPE